MAITQAGFALSDDYKQSRDKAKKIVDTAAAVASKEVMAIYEQNRLLAEQISKDPEFVKSFQAKDSAGMAKVIKTHFERDGFGGYATVIADDILYSSDTNTSASRTVTQENAAFASRVDSGDPKLPPFALCNLSNSGTYCLTSAVRLAGGNGLLGVSTPFGPDLLHGMERKIKISNDGLKDFSMVFQINNKGVTALSADLSADLSNSKPPLAYLIALNRGSIVIKHDREIRESDGRLWDDLPIWGPDGENAIGQIVTTTPVPNLLANPSMLIGLAISSGAAFLLSMFFSAGILNRFNQSMRFLKQRAKDLSANKHDLPSLSVLNGEWLELAEMMDIAFTSPRAVMQNLKQSVSKKDEELQEKQRQVDAINNQLEQVNRQLTAHNRQSTEVSTQVLHANRQAIQIQQKLEAVLQCTSEGFLLLDPYGSVLAANPKFLTWAGVAEREIAGRICFDLVRRPGTARDAQSASFAHPGSGPEDLVNQFYPEGIIYDRSQNKQVEVLMHLQPIVNEEGVIEGYLMVLRDKSLHAEVARLRGEILNLLTDEIRVPLVNAEGHWKAIMAGQLQGVNPQVAQHLIEMHQAYEKMLAVVDSYLMVYGDGVPAPLEQTQREQVSVSRLIGECLEQVSQHARAQQIMLDYKTVTGLPSTGVSKEIVHDIIIQLLEKMISVTAPGGRVRAETTVKGKEIRLIISSSGPALQQVEIEEMFIGFVDGKHSEDTYQSRLSMFLARNNAERLGGRIWAESEAGRGTAIFLMLPVH